MCWFNDCQVKIITFWTLPTQIARYIIWYTTPNRQYFIPKIATSEKWYPNLLSSQTSGKLKWVTFLRLIRTGSSSLKDERLEFMKIGNVWLVTSPVNHELTDARGGFSGPKRLCQCQWRSSFLTNQTTQWDEANNILNQYSGVSFPSCGHRTRTFVLMLDIIWWLSCISVNKCAFLHVLQIDSHWINERS